MSQAGRGRGPGRLLRLAYALCLMGATATHVTIILRHGLFWDYGGAPIPSRVFWTALTGLDPLAAFLLFRRPNAGVALTAAIILADVVHNLSLGLARTHDLGAALADPFMLSQTAFLCFVLATIAWAWEAPPRRLPPFHPAPSQ